MEIRRTLFSAYLILLFTGLIIRTCVQMTNRACVLDSQNGGIAAFLLILSFLFFDPPFLQIMLLVGLLGIVFCVIIYRFIVRRRVLTLLNIRPPHADEIKELIETLRADPTEENSSIELEVIDRRYSVALTRCSPDTVHRAKAMLNHYIRKNGVPRRIVAACSIAVNLAFIALYLFILFEK